MVGKIMSRPEKRKTPGKKMMPTDRDWETSS
jgi:hypothetical protein